VPAPAPRHNGAVKITAFHHVQLAMPLGEEPRAEAFYAGILGLELVKKPPELDARGGCWFRGNGVELHLGIEDDFRPARKAHPAFLVDGLDDLEQRIAERGVEVKRDVELQGHRRFYVDDPFGNRLEFIERD
jgi:catechol 2,3-dioxygenase-like lactoylglutathione lyase family enzyme